MFRTALAGGPAFRGGPAPRPASRGPAPQPGSPESRAAEGAPMLSPRRLKPPLGARRGRAGRGGAGLGRRRRGRSARCWGGEEEADVPRRWCCPASPNEQSPPSFPRRPPREPGLPRSERRDGREHVVPSLLGRRREPGQRAAPVGSFKVELQRRPVARDVKWRLCEEICAKRQSLCGPHATT
uniref:Uncharacterized protein n=1 Tax=Myotis myotis TaxID=51298 RepID=A0A7J7ZY71_MYOMY|nr:hypothetical protein mMyoMyo1_010023 [Myotis myotis]